MEAMLNVAVMAARRGGDTLIRNINKIEKMHVDQKGRNDFVSDADRAAEHAVIETIKRHYPEHAILAEESGQQGDSDHVWVIASAVRARQRSIFATLPREGWMPTGRQA